MGSFETRQTVYPNVALVKHIQAQWHQIVAVRAAEKCPPIGAIQPLETPPSLFFAILSAMDLLIGFGGEHLNITTIVDIAQLLRSRQMQHETSPPTT